MEIEAQKATSINLLFKDVKLPAKARMYLYSLDKKMVSGPITSKNIFKGKYMSDLMYGDKVTVEVIFPKEANILDFSLSIFKVMYGVKPNRYSSDLRGYGDSQPCNIDINCSNTYELQRGAIAVVYPSNGLPCSGSLVMDECNSGRPFFLTAFHCFDPNMDKVLSDDEIEAIENCSFRFNYEHESCIDPVEPQSWLTISGAELRASWTTTDFALVELSSMPQNIIPNTINSGSINDNLYATIHHPQEDVKKISSGGSEPLTDFGNSWIVRNWDHGIVEGGSSGAPLFDVSGGIIGVLHGGSVFQGCPSPNPNDPPTLDNVFFGKMETSWNGGGTSETSLSAWLGGIPPDFDTTNLVDNLSNISGPDVLCHGEDAWFCVNSPFALSGMSWSVTPTSIFSSDTIGSGSCANLVLKDEFKYRGFVTITFTGNFRVYFNCSTPGTLTKKIWIGKPTTPQLNLPECFNSGTNISISADVDGATSYQWVFPSCPSPIPANDPNPDCWFNYDGNTDDQINIYVGQQSGSISLFTSNKCGTTSINVPINFCDPQEPGPGPHIRFQKEHNANDQPFDNFILYPNPSTSAFTIKGDSYLPLTIEIITTAGEIIDKFEYIGSKMEIQTDNMRTGVYLIRLRSSTETRTMKLIVTK